MLHEINALPAHVLLIHLVIVPVPAAAVMLIASAVWPAARARLGFLTPGTGSSRICRTTSATRPASGITRRWAASCCRG